MQQVTVRWQTVDPEPRHRDWGFVYVYQDGKPVQVRYSRLDGVFSIQYDGTLLPEEVEAAKADILQLDAQANYMFREYDAPRTFSGAPTNRRGD